MSFALVKFYEEDTWEVIPVGNIILEERHRGLESLEGLKTLVIWEDPSSSKGKGKARTKYAQKVPAEIIKVSGMFKHILIPYIVIYLFTALYT